MRTPAIAALLSIPLVLAASAGTLSVTQPGGSAVEMPLRHTRVQIEVSAFVARATIEQVFENPLDEPAEAVYTFPLGDRAAVDDFELTVGDRTIRGAIQRREEARQTYEAARAAGYQAALLEQERPNVFTQSVANLAPHEPITVRLRTVETLVYERGTYRLTFPLVVGPRYNPASVADPDRISPPILAPAVRSAHDVDIAVTIDAGVPISKLESPSHRIVSTRAATTARVRLAPGDTIPNKDFLLRWTVSSERPALGLLAHRSGLDGFFTLLVQPKGEVGAQEAAPKEIVFVVDTSGSMSGIPIEASKRLVSRALHELGPRDTFNLVRFAGDNEVFSESPLPNDRASIESAIAWLSRQQGFGGTEMLAAFRAVFQRPADPNRLRVVIFLTDGYVGNEMEILAAVKQVLGQARIYTVGIGSSVNHFLLDRMADLGTGAYVFVRPDESADDALAAFRSWVTKPYLTDLTIDWGALPVADLSPDRIRDLGSGQTLTVVGRYITGGEGDVVVRGKLGGRYWEQTVHVVLPESESRHDALGSLWARGRIEELLMGSPDATTDSTRAEVTALALEHRLMSPFTSFVAVDDSRVVNPGGQARTIHQAVPLPDGVSFEGIFGKEGPAGLRARGAEATPEDAGGDGNPNVDGARDVDFKTSFSGIVRGVGLVTNVAPPAARVARKDRAANVQPQSSSAPLSRVEKVKVAAEGEMGEETKFSSEFIDNLPVAGRSYQNALELSPGVAEPAGAPLGSSARLREAAYRVLADLADDGKLSPSDGKPALAALLAAQRPSGAISADAGVHAIATWALAEAAAANPKEGLVTAARAKALTHLATIAKDPKHDLRAEQWVYFVLHALQPASLTTGQPPSGPPNSDLERLETSLVAAKSGGKPPANAGHTALDRLVGTIGRGKLKVVRA